MNPNKALYITKQNCSSCQVLWPKLEAFMQEHFPKLTLEKIKAEDNIEVVQKYQVLAAPTLIIFYEGKESLRFSGTFGLDEVLVQNQRLYDLFFQD